MLKHAAREGWQLWLAFAGRVAFWQTTLLLLLIYFLTVGPVFLLATLAGKRFLNESVRGPESYWLARPPLPLGDWQPYQKQY